MNRNKLRPELLEYIEKNSNKINELRKVQNTSKENWIKHILTLMTGILSIMIAFDSKNSSSILNHQLFSCVLILTGLSVFSGVVYLHHTIDLLTQKIKFALESLSKRMNGDNDFHFGNVKPKLIYLIFGYVFYISSFFSLVALVLYGITKN